MTDINKELDDVTGGKSEFDEKVLELCGHKIYEHVEIYYEYSILGINRSFGGKIVGVQEVKNGEWKYLIFMDTDSDYTGWYPREAIEGHVYPSAEAVMQAKLN